MSVKLVLFSFLILISIEDIKKFKIENNLLLGMFITCFCISVRDVSDSVFYNTLNSVLFFFLFYIISRITKGIGAGDIKLIFIIAYFAGFFRTIFCLLIASTTGILFICFRYLKNIRTIKIPFAPFITAGFFASEFTFRLVS